MKISGIRQKPNFQNKNVAFGMNFEFSDEFYSTSATKTPEEQKVLIDTFKKLANDETLIKDDRNVEVSPEEIEVFDKHLGSISYPIDLNKDSIEWAVKCAYKDKVDVMTLPDYAKNISQKLGINLSFETDNLFNVIERSPFDKAKTAIDTIAQKMKQFNDKDEINAKIANNRDCTNAFKLTMQRKNKSFSDSMLTNGALKPEDLEERAEITYSRLNRALGDRTPILEEERAEARIQKSESAREKAIDSFTTKFNKALKINI